MTTSAIELTNAMVVEALVAGHGILANAARHLSDRLGQPISRSTLAQRVRASPFLLAAQQAAEERAYARAIESGRQARRQRRSVAMKEAWARRREQTPGAGDLEHVADPDTSNVRARARGSWAPTPATVQAARDRRLCMARTRKGFPCVRRVAPGRNRCVSHGGASTGPVTQAGKDRIAAAQRARWQRWREERA